MIIKEIECSGWSSRSDGQPLPEGEIEVFLLTWCSIFPQPEILIEVVFFDLGE